MPDPLVVGSPEWWRQRLEKQLDDRRPRIDSFSAYYDGVHRMAFATGKFREAFGSLFKGFADNWCALVVDAVEERLNVDGFRFGEQQGDTEAWRIWQENQLDAASQLAHTEALVCEEAYGLVWGTLDGQPLITVEHPSQVAVAHDPGRPRWRNAALKKWAEDDGTLRAVLYLPDAVYKWRTRKPVTSTSRKVLWDPWQPDTDDVWPLPNPLGVVPVVPLVNRRRMLASGRSEIADVIPVQDAVNKLCADMMVAAEFVAMPQRWVTGLDIPKDPTTNQPIEPFKAAVNRVWAANPKVDEDGNVVGEGVRFGQFPQADLGPYVNAIEMYVQHIASLTRTPPHYLNASADRLSGESIKAAETGLVAKAKRKMRHFGEGWEEIMRLSFAVLDDARSKFDGAETVWADPESRTESQHVDAVAKKKDLGVPWEFLMEDLNYSPQQIARMRALRQQEAAFGLDVDVDELIRQVGGDAIGTG